MSDAWIGLAATLAGAVLGAGITWLTEWQRRRWEQRDRVRAEAITRAEELVAITEQLFEWQSVCFSDAVRGNIRYPPSIVFRMGVVVSGYFPELESRASDLGKALLLVHSACADIAFHVQKDDRSPVPTELADAAKRAMSKLSAACVQLTDDVGRLLRETRLN